MFPVEVKRLSNKQINSRRALGNIDGDLCDRVVVIKNGLKIKGHQSLEVSIAGIWDDGTPVLVHNTKHGEGLIVAQWWNVVECLHSK